MSRTNKRMTRVAHLITDLDTGGAEVMLCRLLEGVDRSRFTSDVVSMTGIGPVGRSIQALGIRVWSLGMRRGVPNPSGLARMARYLSRYRPAILQCWMYHSNLLGSLAATLAGVGTAVVWGLHHSSLESDKWLTRITARACGLISAWSPTRIVCCSDATRRYHGEMGYCRGKSVVIENGFDTDRYRPDPAAAGRLAKELGLDHDVAFIALVGRFHPQKDHRTFIDAASCVIAQYRRVHAVLCGDGVVPESRILASWVAGTPFGSHFHLLGRRDDVSDILAASIVVVSAASGEAFPMVIGEAMSCGSPCVVTDVGDSARLVADTGVIVPPRNPEALATGILKVLAMSEEERTSRGRRARERICQNFAIDHIVQRYQNLYDEVSKGEYMRRAPSCARNGTDSGALP